MPSTSSGRIIKTTRGKRGTDHQKNHRWESFTSKVAKLNSLDPLRRVRRHDLDSEDVSTATSYFRSGLEKWQDLNMSETFTAFCHEVLPLCDSLPQILHFESKIIGFLVAGIEKREKESLEPLLELLTDFAHDLGVRFEKHFSRSLDLVTGIAGSQQDVAVIEWSFSCLAFLFKYLSKLLVSDLRKTYDAVAPLMGKQRQPPHIARFSAEGMSFLLKKAGTPANKEKALPLIIHHTCEDLANTIGSKEFSLYRQGVMTMLAESIKGNGLSIHSSGPAIFRSLFREIENSDLTSEVASMWTDVISGVLVSLVHHTSSETVVDISDIIIQEARVSSDTYGSAPTESNLRPMMVSFRTIGTLAGVRKGSRVNDWQKLLSSLSILVVGISKHPHSVTGEDEMIHLWRTAMLSTAIAFKYSPMEAIIPLIPTILESLMKDPFAPWFLSFSSYVGQLEADRFRTIILPYFQRFIIGHWSDAANEDCLCIILPQMVSMEILSSPLASTGGFGLPQSWQDQVVSKFERLELSPFPEQGSSATQNKNGKWYERCLPHYYALLDVLDSTNVHPSTNARIGEILLRKLKLALRPSFALAADEAHFISGRGFYSYCRMTKASGQFDFSLAPLLRAAATRYCRLPTFLEAMLLYETSISNDMKGTSKKTPLQSTSLLQGYANESNSLTSALVRNLTTPSQEIRLRSLRLLAHFQSMSHQTSSDAILTMLQVEQTPLDLQAARSTAMHLRRLASQYKHLGTDSLMQKAIPYFCFGMLTVKLTQIWDDSCAALREICEDKLGEDIVTTLLFDWLQTKSFINDGSAKNAEKLLDGGLTDFECSNLNELEQLSREVSDQTRNAQSIMLSNFEIAQRLVSERPSNARGQALRVLSVVPHIVEKHSRQLMPMFLAWAGNIDVEDQESSQDQVGQVSDWSRKDQKSLLNVFQNFTNPKVLFRSQEVFSALLKLLTNGDVDIQRSALKAIFTWKIAGVKPYEENLLNLLDEARFREEISVLLPEDTQIHANHRQDVTPILLRLLYGRVVSRGRPGMESRRLAVLRNLNVEDTGEFLNIAMGPLRSISLTNGNDIEESIFQGDLLSVRKQAGFLNMLQDMVQEMGASVLPYAKTVLDSLLYCAVSSNRRLQTEESEKFNDEKDTSPTSLLRSVRQIGLKCLITLFTNIPSYDWTPYTPIILNELVSPRLEKLPAETAQGVSAVLRLISTWCSYDETILLLTKDDRILDKVAECLTAPKVQDAVCLYVLDILDNIIKIASVSEDSATSVTYHTKNDLLGAHMENILHQINLVLRSKQDISKLLLEATVATVSNLASFVTGTNQAHSLIDISVYLLDQPSRRVNPKTKSGLLLVLEHFVPLYKLDTDDLLKNRIFNTISSLFGFFKDRVSRDVLSRVLLVYARNDTIMSDVAAVCSDLNSFLTAKIEEPDYDRRLQAFNTILKKPGNALTPHQWLPILFNLLYYIQHDEEFGILSSNSSDGICHFLDCATSTSSNEERDDYFSSITTILLPAIYTGVREQSEIIRREYVKVMSHLIKAFPDRSELNNMKSLIRGEDEVESSFFSNILSAGKGRQSSALGQLSHSSENGELSSHNISHFFIPLIEHFVFDRAEGNEAHNLAAETTTVIGVVVASLEWSQFRALLRRYISYVQLKPELEKQVIRLVGKVIDTLANLVAARENFEEVTTSNAVNPVYISNGSTRANTSRLAATAPNQSKLADDLNSNILPPLLGYLHDKDESTVSLRVPVAVIVVRLLKLLPEAQLFDRLPAVLTDICHILRSKAQESRDMARDTLAKICALLGPSSFGFLLKELRNALPRGYQLHVLSYTMHSILVALTPEFKPGDLDYCLPSIVAVIMDDIFGAIGQEKDAEEYISKMKEVKSSKSHDSMELIVKTATLRRLTTLIRPIQVLLNEKLSLKIVRKIDELLARISTGLLRNTAVQSRDSLILCYEIIQDVHKEGKAQDRSKQDYRLKRYLLQKGASKSGSRGSTTVYSYKLVRFAFDVVRLVVKKYDHLRTPGNFAGFVPILGDSLIQGEEEVKIAAFRLLTAIVKIPTTNSYDGASLFRVAAREASKSFSSASSTSSEISQASLKLVSVILRDRRHDVPIKEKSIDSLLEKLKDDFTNPEHRHVTFNFLRAILDSKVETAVVYDTVDYVGTIMVTNDDKSTRDLARGAYFQFLREYSQKRTRWSKQLKFIIANLEYDREGGRLSVLEVIHLLLSKSSTEFMQEVATTCFFPLLLVLVNDDSEKCRSAAAEVIKEIFRKSDNERTQSFLSVMKAWPQQRVNLTVIRLALLSYGFYYGVKGSQDGSDVSILTELVTEILQSAQNPEADWELIYSALNLAITLCQTFPSRMLTSATSELWQHAQTCLSFPHAWVKQSSAKLFEMYFTDLAEANADRGLTESPMLGSNGIVMSKDKMIDLLRRFVGLFRTPNLSEGLATEAVKNLLFLGRCSAAINLDWKENSSREESDEEEDDNTANKSGKRTALGYLFSRLSFHLRRETLPPRAPALVPKTAALQLLQLLCSKIPTESLTPSLQTILLPLQNLTDPLIPIPYSTDDEFRAKYEALKSSSVEIMSALQSKCGTSGYSSQLLKVREGVKARRNQRSSKRRIEAVSAPEKFGKDKKKKVERKKERRKEKGLENRDRRRAY